MQNRLNYLANIVDYSISGLCRKYAKNSSVLVAFSLVIFVFSSFLLITSGLKDSALRLLQSVPDITVQQLSAGRQVGIDRAWQENIAAIWGVSAVTPRVWGYYFDETTGANFTVVGLPEAVDYSKIHDFTLAQGHYPTTHSVNEVVISDNVRILLGLNDRKFFTFFRPGLSQISFETVGVFSKTTEILTADLILMKLTAAQDLFLIVPQQVTDFLVYVTNPLETNTIARKITEIIPGARVVTKEQILKTYNVVFDWRSGVGSVCLLVALFAFIILAWDKASGMSEEEKREVAILKLLGWQTRDIMLVRFTESLIVAFLSFVIGWTTAWLHILAGGSLFSPVLLGWSVLRPEINVVPPLTFSDTLLIFVLSVVPYLCATIIPVWKSSTIRAESVL